MECVRKDLTALDLSSFPLDRVREAFSSEGLGVVDIVQATL
jgi:hypothetical protein